MAIAKKVRLYKIASEINIGKDTIVNYLQSKGFDIQNKPTAQLDEEMQNIIREKFKREARAAEVQREKIQKHKVNKKPKTEDEVVDTDQELLDARAGVGSSKEILEETKDNALKTDVNPSDKVEETKETEEVQEINSEVSEKDDAGEDETLPGIKVGDVIELPDSKPKSKSQKNKVKPSKKDKPVREETPKVEEKPKEEAKVEKVDTIIPEKEEPKAEEAPKVEEKSKEEPKEAKVEKVDTEVPEKEEPKVEEIPKVEKEDKAIEDSTEDKHDKKKKQQKIIEVKPEEDNKLKGLTVLGKIDVSKEKAKAKTKKRRPKKDEVDEELIEPKKGYKKPKPRKDKAAEVQDTDESKPKKVKPKEEVQLKTQDRKKRKRKKSIREQISEKDVQKAIRQTMAGIEEGSTLSNRQKLRQKKKQEREEKEQIKQEQQEQEQKILKLTEFVTTSDLANMMGVSPNEIILKCMELGLMVTINQRLDKDSIALIVDDYGYEVEFMDEQEIQFIEDDDDPEETLKHRPPIVTIMGHVDHGKTSLLDHIREANVVAGEAGGITQHIGAYQVAMPDDKVISFLDTPGHEAFTAMRARGAQVTDIVVLVVAADDSVMPQTIEAISHAQAASVPIVVAINKIDKPDANPDRIKQQLSDHGILVEDWGGKYQSIEISAKKGINIDNLLEKILLEAELLELKANPDRNARGVVIESNMTKGMGATATVMIQKGTLSIGDPFVAGVYSGRVRSMHDEKGDEIKIAGPSKPVLVTGFEGLPEAGDSFVVSQSDTEARNIANERKQLKREQEIRRVRQFTLDEISAQISQGGVKDLNLVIKGDVGGSVEALSDALLKLGSEEVRVNILHKGVGAVTETDVMLASASGAVIIGFNVSPNVTARKLAETESVDIRKYDIIYDCINEIQMALEGLLSPDIKEEIKSEVEIRQTFKISKVGTIAGCYVLSGKINRNDKVRVIRDGIKVFDGAIASLKRGKDDVKEVDQKFECGIQLEGFNDVKVDDIIEAYKLVEIKRTLN